MYRTHPTGQSFAGIGLMAVLLFFIVVLSALNVLIGPFALLPYMGLASLVLFFWLPLDVLMMLALFSASVVAGLVDYFASIQQAYWLPYLMGLLFLPRGIGERLRAPSAGDLARSDGINRRGMNPLVMPIAAYFAVGIFATVVAAPPVGQVFAGIKNYWFMWGTLAAVAWCALPARTARWFWNGVVVVACMQLPVTLYQRFVVAARRTDSGAWDAVVGTFGGNPESGGHSASMALLLCLAVAVLLWRVRTRKISTVYGAGLILICMAPIALAEVKAAFIWLAIVFLLLFANQFRRNPAKALLTLLIGTLLLIGVGWIYKTTFYKGHAGGQSLEQIYDKQISYALDPNEFSAEYGRLGRIAALKFWWQRHNASADALHFFVGHGLGASRGSSALGVGSVARKYSVALDTTGASTLLWDVGLIGALAFMGILVIGAQQGLRWSKLEHLSEDQRETALLSGILLALAALGLIYNRDAIDMASVQFLIYFSLGQLVRLRPSTFAAEKPILNSGAGRAFAIPASGR